MLLSANSFRRRRPPTSSLPATYLVCISSRLSFCKVKSLGFRRRRAWIFLRDCPKSHPSTSIPPFPKGGSAERGGISLTGRLQIPPIPPLQKGGTRLFRQLLRLRLLATVA